MYDVCCVTAGGGCSKQTVEWELGKKMQAAAPNQHHHIFQSS